MDRKHSLFVAATLVGTLIIVGLATAVLDEPAATVLDDFAQLGCGLAAAGTCLFTARRHTGTQRRWRTLMGFGMVAWSIGTGFWTWYQVVAGDALPSPSLADIGFFAMPVLALMALLVLSGASPGRAPVGARHLWFIAVIDAVIVVGIFFMITWATALGAVVHAGAPTRLAFLVAVGYPVSDMMLVVMVFLLATTRRVGANTGNGSQLWLLGAGLVLISISDSAFAYLVAQGAESVPHIADAGSLAGPVLIALAATVPRTRPGTAAWGRPQQLTQRAQILLPYLLFGGAVTVIAARLLVSDRPDPVLIWVAWIAAVAMLTRQALTMTENLALLSQVNAAREELAHRADHDPLTGLANRALLQRELLEAIAGLRRGRPVSLMLIDLDGFKAVNDRFGHAVGDEVLVITARRLRGCVRPADTVARLGGDEFVVLVRLPAADADAAADRIRAALDVPCSIAGRSVGVGASLGIAHAVPGDPDVSADRLLHAADRAMYTVKQPLRAGQAPLGINR